MALQLEWYDFVCFGIVVVALLGSVLVIWMNEGSRSRSSYEEEDTSFTQNLLSGVGSLPVGHVGPDKLWSTCWKGVHPGWLLATRLFSLLVMAGFLTRDIFVWQASIYVYYTEWTFTLVMVYFGLGTIISAYGCWVHSCRSPATSTNGVLKIDAEEGSANGNGVILRRRYTGDGIFPSAGFCGYLMQILYQASAGAVVITDVVFWCVIVPFLSTTRLGLNWLMGCMHTLNLFFLLIETSLNSLPFPWFRLAYFVLWTCAYVIFQWVLHASGFSWWPYPFMVMNSPWAPLWYFALAVLHIPCYAAYVLIVKAKNAVFARWFPHAFLRPK